MQIYDASAGIGTFLSLEFPLYPCNSRGEPVM
jgi:hypothetical protein